MLVANWREVLRHAWSIKFIVAAAILTGLEVALPLVGFAPSGKFAAVSFFVTVGAFVTRLLAQPTINERESK